MNLPTLTLMHTLIQRYNPGNTICLLTMLLFGVAFSSFAQQKKMNFVADPANGAAPKIKAHLLEIQQSINHPDSWKGIYMAGDHPAIGLLNQAIDKYDISDLQFSDTVHLLSRVDNTYEVRDMYVRSAKTNPLSHRTLALQFDSDAQLIGAKVLPQINNYQLALDRQITTSSEKQKRVSTIIQEFQDALAEKNEDKLLSMLTSDAHVVKGGIARYSYQGTYGPYYQYKILSVDQFIDDMTDQHTSRRKISYENFEVYQLPGVSSAFVATFSQQWTTKNYSDHGYVAMVVDLNGKPSIPVRVWQKNPFSKGELQQEISRVLSLPETPLATPYSANKKITFKKVKTHQKEEKSGFFAANKRWFLMGLGASAAITTGAILLRGGENSELPNPPGRPAFR